MLFASTGQAEIFLFAVFAGLLMGACYDVLRAVRHALQTRAIVTGLLDGVFWVCALVIACASAYRSSYGDLRLYLLLGYASGGGLYAAAISPWLFRVQFALIRLISSALRKLKASRLFKRIIR